MRLIVTIIFMLTSVYCACAQQTDEDYYLYKFDYERERVDAIIPDSSNWRKLEQQSGDIYSEVADYKFSFVDMSRRGFAFYERAAWLDGMTIEQSEVSTLRRLKLSEARFGGISVNDNMSSLAAGSDNFSILQSVPFSATEIGTFVSGRGYLGGIRATIHSMMLSGWSLSMHIKARGGDDLYVNGVFNNSVDAGFRLSKDFLSGANLSFLLLANVGERGLRSGSVEEAFTLLSDNLYNPNWGRQNADVRSSRVRQDYMPFAMMSYASPIGKHTHMQLSLGGRYGERSYSSLGWYGAMTPRPDNYRYLPSYYADEQVSKVVADEWRRGNEQYSQINWTELYHQNSMSNRGAVYALEDRVERLSRAELSLRFSTDFGGGLSVRYGLQGRYNTSRNFKRMNDLLGAPYLDDIDYYLLDDDTFSRNLQNNLQNPNRRVVEGDRFSYDYSLVELNFAADAALEYEVNRWRLTTSLHIANSSMWRYGFYEKEIFAGDKSFGRSRVESFAPYVFKALVAYNLSERNTFDVGIMAAKKAPDVENIFLNAEYNNRIVDNPSAESHLAAEFNYKYLSEQCRLIATAYGVITKNQMDSFRAYDDLSAEYCDVVMTGLATARYGVELAGEFKIFRDLKASFAASAARYLYSENPLLSFYADADNSVICTNSTSYVGECNVGGAPQISGVAQLTYLSYRGWAATCSIQAAVGRYADVSFIRRTERVARQASASAEIYNEFMQQQRFDDAMTLDASISRWFNLRHCRLSLTVAARNLLGQRDIIYGGYEQSRIRNYMSGPQRIYAPQPNIITYSYPRTWYGVVSWKF
jgi:hypothetical protein